jgi:ketosteroid isomerase-like protein
MSEEESRRAVERVWEEVINERRLDFVEDLIAEEYVYHGPGELEVRGPDGFRRFIGSLHEMFDDVHVTIHEYITEGDRVLSRWTGRGHNIDTDRDVRWRGATITHVVEGRMIEDWEYWDRLELAEQLVTGWMKERLVEAVTGAVEERLPSD